MGFIRSFRVLPKAKSRLIRSEFCEAKSRCLSVPSKSVGFVSRKGRTDYFQPSKTKGPLGGGPCSAGPKCVSRRFRFVSAATLSFSAMPRRGAAVVSLALCRPGSDLLSRVLRRSTIGAGAFHGRVRNGNGCSHPARTTRSAKRKICA